MVAASAGALNALWLRYAGPDTSLSFSIMLDILLMVVIGGMGTIYGALIGATIFILAQNYLQALMGVASNAAAEAGLPLLPGLLHPDRWLLWLGLLFIASVYFFPAGVVGRLRAGRAPLPDSSPVSSTEKPPMSFYDVSVPAFLQILGSLQGLLTKAEAHCEAKKIAPEVLLGSRLYPDMLPLSKQIQLATDFAMKGCARLTHSDVPSTPDTEKTFAELKQRLANAVDYIKTFKPAQFEGADVKDVSFPVGPNNMTVKGQQFLAGFAFPNFYFHAAIAHGILRHNGVEIGKRDFLGA